MVGAGPGGETNGRSRARVYGLTVALHVVSTARDHPPTSKRLPGRPSGEPATTLFAALDIATIATGAVIGKCSRRHRAMVDLGFLKETGAAMPEGLDMHQVVDDGAMFGTEKVRKWLARRGHWHAHFTAAPASWLTQVERWFAELARKKLQRGVHRAVAERRADIMSCIDAHNEKPKPCKRVRSADEILASARKFCLKANERGKSGEI